MSRPQDGLARLISSERPEWVSARSWGAARTLVESLRADVAEALDDGPLLAADALGVSRSTLFRWMGADGWLAK